MPNKPLAVVVVGNYAADGLESMLRFARCLEALLPREGIEVVPATPELKWGKAFGPYRYRGFPKWLGYIDKYLVFPRRLEKRLAALRMRGPVVVHVLDHGNANYVPRRRQEPWVVTCHDLLAVRAALGQDTQIRPSRMGRIQQQAIVAGLLRADRVVCDSVYTQNDWRALQPDSPVDHAPVVWVGLNHPYRRLDTAVAWSRLDAAGFGELRSRPFLLHIGSNQPRKNRDGFLRMAVRLAQTHEIGVVLAGPDLNEALSRQVAELGLGARLTVIVRPDNDVVEALYNTAHALLFPSHFEGFGWPVAEAQACGCPVVCANTSSLPEVAGDGALLHAVADEAGMMDSLSRLFDPVVRGALIERGTRNVERFAPERMAQGYAEIYQKLAEDAGGGNW